MLRRLNKFSMIEHNLFSQPFKNTKVKKKKTQLINARYTLFFTSLHTHIVKLKEIYL